MVADTEMDPAAPASSPTGVEATGVVDGGKKEEARDEATVADAATDAAAPAPSSTEDEASGAEDGGKEEEAHDEAAKEEPEADEAAKEEKAEPEVSPSGRSRRVRKSIEKFVPEVVEKKEKEIPEGKGERLEDMPNVVANLKAVTWSDPRLYDLYTIIFGVGKKKEFKAHLLQFNGLALPEGKEEAERERLRNKIYRLKTAGLKAVMDLADIDRSAESFGDKKATPGKELLCDRFLEWLECPKASGKKPKAEKKKRKSSGSTGSAKKAKKSTKKKTPTKKAPAEEAPAEEDPAEESTTAEKKVAKKKKDKKKALKDNNGKEKASLVIPGTDIEKIRAKVKTIVETENKDELTVKAIRKRLEDWLDMDLSDQKDAVRTIVMEVM